jgi:hypothetical protein
LEESALTSMRVDCFFLRIEEKNPSLSMAGVAGVRQLGPCARLCLPPQAKEEPTSSMERRGRHTGATRWNGSSSSPRNLTLLAGGGGQHRGRRPGTWPRGLLLAEPPLESRAIPATETRLRRRRGRRKPEKGIEGGRQGRAFIKKIRMHK